VDQKTEQRLMRRFWEGGPRDGYSFARSYHRWNMFADACMAVAVLLTLAWLVCVVALVETDSPSSLSESSGRVVESTKDKPK
jgi:hypothetical protein